MKKFHQIISNLRTQNRFRKLNENLIIDKLLLSLPQQMRKNIVFSLIKNNVLLIAMRHPAFSSEFNNFYAQILTNIIKEAQNVAGYEILRQIEFIKAYMPTNILNEIKESVEKEHKIWVYKERSNGEWKVDCDNIFKAQFDEIKAIIKKNLNESST